MDRSLSAPDTRSFSVWQSLLRRGKERESLEAVAGLAELGSPEALQELVWALEHRNSRVRSAARAALVRRGDLETALAVGTVLFHGPRGVRRTAEAVLAACGLPAAKAVLFPFLEDRRAVVRAEAARVLERLGWYPSNGRERALQALARWSWRGVLREGAEAVAVLALALQDPDPGSALCRLRACEALGELRDAAALEPLRAALHDPEPAVREAAGMALASLGPGAAPGLTAALASAGPGTAAAAGLGLLELGQTAVPALIQLLQHGDRIGQHRAVGLLLLQGPEVLELLRPLLQDPRVGVRSAVVQALDGLPWKTAEEGLITALMDPAPHVADLALRSLRRRGWLPRTGYEIGLQAVVRQDWARAEACGEPAVPGLLPGLRHEHRVVRRGAVRTLGRIGSAQAVPALLELLQDPEPSLRAEATDALGRIGGPAARAGLVQAAGDYEAVVRCAAAAGMGVGYTPELLEPLLELVEDDASQVRAVAAAALGNSRSREAIGPLTQLLQDPIARVRVQACRALGEINSPDVVPSLVAYLNQETIPEARRAAVAAVGQPGQILALPAVLCCLADPHRETRLAAVEAAGRIGSLRALPALQERLHPRAPTLESDLLVQGALKQAIREIRRAARTSRETLPLPSEEPVAALHELPLPASGEAGALVEK